MTGRGGQQGAEFLFRFRGLIALCWAIPPIFGLSFLLFVVELFTPRQLGLALLAPPLPLYVIGAQLFSDVYFRRFAGPIVAYLDDPNPETEAEALARARAFPAHFWTIFLTYLVIAPVSVMASAYLGYGFVAGPLDWLRAELTSLVVSIIVGLPIFFSVIDLFGRTFRSVDLARPHISLRMKVFLIGALIPLLIDTMLVQYFWTATGYFTWGTFSVWLVLELLAVAGALMMVQSLQQSMAPLRATMGASPKNVDYRNLQPMSTDELGVLSSGYRKLLQGLQHQEALLSVRNELLRLGRGLDITHIVALVDRVTRETIGVPKTIIATLDVEQAALAVVSFDGQPYSEAGHVRLERGSASALWSAVDAQAVFTITTAEPDDPVGEIFDCGSAAVAPMLADGNVIGILAACADDPRSEWSTAQLSLLEAIGAEAGRLIQGAVLRRRQEELETQLQHAQRMEGVGRLAGGVAHDFNNILTALVGTASLMRMDDITPEQDRSVTDILRCAQRATNLTRQLLAFSRRQMLTLDVLDVNEVVSGLERMLRRLVPSRIELQLELTPGLWPVFADPGQLEQVVVNLVVNAKDAIEDQGRVIIRTENRMGPKNKHTISGEWVVLSVADTGTGIPAAVADRIFDPYFTTKEEGKGTGLGLATVYGIVSQIGGEIVVDGDYSEGARFEVRLPRTDASANGDVADGPDTFDGVQLEGRTALVVEDDAVLRGVVAQTLERHGVHVHLFGRGDEAVAFVKTYEGPLDLLLTDVVMPGMTGTNVARALETLRPDAKVLLMSGYADVDTLEEIHRAGFPFIPKPFGPEELTKQVLRTLRGRRTADISQTSAD